MLADGREQLSIVVEALSSEAGDRSLARRAATLLDLQLRDSRRLQVEIIPDESWMRIRARMTELQYLTRTGTRYMVRGTFQGVGENILNVRISLVDRERGGRTVYQLEQNVRRGLNYLVPLVRKAAEDMQARVENRNIRSMVFTYCFAVHSSTPQLEYLRVNLPKMLADRLRASSALGSRYEIVSVEPQEIESLCAPPIHYGNVGFADYVIEGTILPVSNSELLIRIIVHPRGREDFPFPGFTQADDHNFTRSLAERIVREWKRVP